MFRMSCSRSGLRILGVLLTIPIAISQFGCVGLGAAAAGVSSASTSGNRLAPVKLMLFGGQNHETYLGCLNCSEYARDSIFNEFGQAGNRYSTNSIWNAYGQFGSLYSSYSACNPYASDPPVIVDAEGSFYGRLTVNEYHAQIASGRQYLSWLKTKVCAQN